MSSRSQCRPRFIAGRALLGPALLFTAALACAFPSPADPTPVVFAIQGTRSLTDDYAYYRSPAWSPDGRLIAALRSQTYPQPRGPASEGDVVLFDLDSGGQERIVDLPKLEPGKAYPPVLWQPGGTGISFYYFDLLGGQEVPYLVGYEQQTDKVTTIDFCRCGRIAFSSEGTELLVVDPTDQAFQLSWFNLATGQMRSELSLLRDIPRAHQYFGFSLSPDGRILLLDDLDGSIFRYEIGSGTAPAIFLAEAASPAWSPDGSRVLFSQLRRRGTSSLDYYDGELMIANSDGSSPERLISETQPAGMLSPAWSPDGKQIAFLYGTSNSNSLLIADIPERLRP